MGLFSNKGQSALQFRTEVSFLARDLDWLSGRFATQPMIQFLAGRLNVSSLLLDWHAFIRPSLRDRDWLAKECGNLLPALENVGVNFGLLTLRHGASRMPARVLGLQSAQLT